MAHWCFNKLAIHGDQEEVNAAVAQMRGSYSDGSECLFAFERVFPSPSDVDSLGIDWHYENWGTSRYPVHCLVCPDEAAEFTLEFSTASGPATGVVAALALQHPHLRFVHLYDFDDYGYGGELTYEDGVIIDEKEWEEEDEEVEASGPAVTETTADDDGATPRDAPIVRTRRSSLAEGGAGAAK